MIFQRDYKSEIKLLLLFSLQMRARRKNTTLLLVMYNEVFILLLMGGTGTEQKNEYMYINRLYCNWICPQIVTILYPYEVMRLVSKHDNPIANNVYRTLSHYVLKNRTFYNNISFIAIDYKPL